MSPLLFIYYRGSLLTIVCDSYGNMDYIFGSALYHFMGLLLCIVGYDIACQWFTHIYERSEKLWPGKIKLDDAMELVPVIGKFHEPAHETENHEQFSCNLVKRVGFTDFEACERIWGCITPWVMQRRRWPQVHELTRLRLISGFITGRNIPGQVSPFLSR